MSKTDRSRPCRLDVLVCALQLLASAALLELAACSATNHPRSCDDSQGSTCGPGAYCVAGACVNGRLPEAELVVPPEASLVTYSPLTFSARASDPNGKAIRKYEWSVAPDKLACAPHLEQSDPSRPELHVLFKCAGRYDLKLTVTNEIALSASASATVTVSPSDLPPVIEPLADIAVDHRCETVAAAEPAGTSTVVCAAGQDLDHGIPLSVLARDAGGSTALSYSWTWDPPEGISRDDVRVRFAPLEDSNAPTVHLETDGKHIAGTYTLHVHVADARGRVNVADQRIVVGNTPPVITVSARAPLEVDHRYDPATQTFLATAPLAAQVIDPDGDPLDAATAGATIVEEMPSGCSVSGKATFAPVSATLSGEATLSASLANAPTFLSARRAVRLSIADVNGAAASGEAPLVVKNRPPALTVPAGGGGSASVTVSHLFAASASGGNYTASGASPYLAVDPDGDPLKENLTFSSPPAGLSVGTTDGSTRFTLQSTEPAALRDAYGNARVSFHHMASDSWASTLEIQGGFGVIVTNQPPAPASVLASPTVTARYDVVNGKYLVEAILGRFTDHESDPMTIEGGAHDACRVDLLADGTLKATCAVPYAYQAASGPPSLAGLVEDHPLQFSVKDGWSGSSIASVLLHVNDGLPLRNDGGTLTNEACVCDDLDRCTGQKFWRADPDASASLPILDPDGTPVWVSYPGRSLATLGGIYVSGHAVFALDVTATDGVRSPVTAHWQIFNTCSKTGQVCGKQRGDPSYCTGQ